MPRIVRTFVSAGARAGISVASMLAAILAAGTLAPHAWPQAERPASERSFDLNNGRFVALGTFYQEEKWACVRCHGMDGAANSSGAFPRLADQSASYLYKALQDYTSGRRPNPIMTPIARTMTDTEMRDVSAYYAAIENAPYPAATRADSGTLAQGEAIAASGVPGQAVPPCNSCHGAEGIGGAPVYPYLAGQFAPYLQHQLESWRTGRRGGDPMNVMELIAKAMSDEQILAVSRYYASLRPAEVTPNEQADTSALNAWNLPAEGGSPESR